MAEIPTSQFAHYCSEIDAAVDEVIAARGSEASLSERLAAIASDFEYDQDRQDAEIQGKTSIAQLFGVKTSLQPNTDLDSLAAGVAACGGATVAATLLHCPTTTDAFIIFTDYVVADSRRIQRIYGFNTVSGVPSIFIRSQYSGGWSAWYQVSLQQAATVQSAPASLMQAGRIDAELTDAETLTNGEEPETESREEER